MNMEFMQRALEVARSDNAEVPVGAVVVKDGMVIASSCNQKEMKQDATKHAEMVVIQEASKKLTNWRLDGCELYITLEPCPMCAFAILQSRISKVYFGAYDNLYGAFGSKINLKTIFDSKTEIRGGLLEDECNNIISDFFKELR